MEKIAENIYTKLKVAGIHQDFSKEIEDMKQKGILNEEMSLKGAYNAFLLSMGHSHPIFLKILKNEYLFDLTFRISRLDTKTTQIFEKIKAETSYFEYFYILESNDDFLHLGVKFSEKIYDYDTKCDYEAHIQPYKLLAKVLEVDISELEFDQYLFPYKESPDVKKVYASFIEVLKTANLPLRIVSDDILFENTNITNLYDVYLYLEDSGKWPNDQDAIDCAKTAFYCQLYSKVSFRTFIDKKYCVFNYKGFYFKVRIILKQDFNVKYNVLMKLNAMIKAKTCHFHRKIKMIKAILANLGFYPLILDDFLVDSLSLAIRPNIVGDARFIEEFLMFDFDLDKKVLNLENAKLENNQGSKGFKVLWKDDCLSIGLPNDCFISEIKQSFFEARRNFFKMTWNSRNATIDPDPFRMPCLSDYTFVLSTEQLDASFKEIIGAMNSSDLNLVTPEYKDFIGSRMLSEAKCYYSPTLGLLMVKVNEGYNVDFIANIFILETSFSYIKHK